MTWSGLTDFGNGFVQGITAGGCDTTGCGGHHNSNPLFSKDNPLDPNNIIKEVMQQIMSLLQPLIVPFLLVIGGAILLPVVFDVITMII
jgi:hypothetical protein